MDIYATRKVLKTTPIYDIPLRVTFYARVSSESDEQLNSLENQTSYYKELIKKNKKWIYVKGYIDEGISGASAEKRESFQKMIRDSQSDKFDLIITKEITRFARNTLDSIQYTRELLSNGVAVFFQNDNINTLDEDSELRLTIMAGIAQDELRKLSSRVKFGHAQAIKKGVVIGNSRIFGYKKDRGRLVIDESQAKMVKLIFELYATGSYSMKQIENILWEKGYRNTKGNKISHTTLSNTISNPKYKGYYVGNKVKNIDLFSKKRKFLPQEEWVMYKDETGEIVPAIVSEEIWDRANKVLKERSLDVKTRQNKCNHANLLTGKLICTHCGTPYYRKDSNYTGKRISMWQCSGRIKNGSDSCPSFSIREDEIKSLIFDIFLKTKDTSLKYIDEYIKIMESETLDDEERTISDQNEIIKKAERKKAKILELLTDNMITSNDFDLFNKQCSEDIKNAKKEISKVSDKINLKKKMMLELNDIKRVIKDISSQADDPDNKFDISAAFINKYIDKIYATPHGDEMTLEIKLFSGETISGEKNLSRSGHINKKICPEQIYEFVRNDRTAIGHQRVCMYTCTLCF